MVSQFDRLQRDLSHRAAAGSGGAGFTVLRQGTAAVQSSAAVRISQSVAGAAIAHLGVAGRVLLYPGFYPQYAGALEISCGGRPGRHDFVEYRQLGVCDFYRRVL